MGILGRVVVISWQLGMFGLWWVLQQAGFIRARQTPPERLCDTFERLGTAFVKLGQMLSIRQDMLPPDYVEAMQSLQDEVKPFPVEVAVSIIEKELRRPIGEVFSLFETTPHAAASIAQVHRATLFDGLEVIVKVRRPGIQRLVAQDLAILRGLLRIVLPLVPPLQHYEPIRLIRDIEANMRQEMDFNLEARNIRRFGRFFEQAPLILVPQVVEGLHTEAVLVQAYCEGVRVDHFDDPIDGPVLAEAFVEAYLSQWFVFGHFHGDPHPGNVLITPDHRICLIDFGLVGYIDQRTRRHLGAYMQAFTCRDADWVLDSYLAMGGLAGDIDRDAFRYGLEELLSDYGSLPISEVSYAQAFLRVARMGRGHHVRIPQHLLVLNRALFLMENILQHLHPTMNLTEVLSRKVERLVEAGEPGFAPSSTRARLRHEGRFVVEDLPESVAKLMHKWHLEGIKVPIDLRGLTDLEKHLDRASNRMALALVTLGLYIASSLLMHSNLGPRVANFPILAGMGYWLAIWLTLSLANGIYRSGKL